MKLIQLKNQVEDFCAIDFSGIDVEKVFKNGNIEILEGKNLKWLENSGSIKGDCPFYIGAYPIFDTEKLGKILNNLPVKTATFSVEGSSYTAVSAHQFVGEIINRERSVMRSFKSGKIMNVSSYVFNTGFKYPAIFIPAEYPIFTFCDLNIARALLNCHFQQLLFVECPIE